MNRQRVVRCVIKCNKIRTTFSFYTGPLDEWRRIIILLVVFRKQYQQARTKLSMLYTQVSTNSVYFTTLSIIITTQPSDLFEQYVAASLATKNPKNNQSVLNLQLVSLRVISVATLALIVAIFRLEQYTIAVAVSKEKKKEINDYIHEQTFYRFIYYHDVSFYRKTCDLFLLFLLKQCSTPVVRASDPLTELTNPADTGIASFFRGQQRLYFGSFTTYIITDPIHKDFAHYPRANVS